MMIKSPTTFTIMIKSPTTVYGVSCALFNTPQVLEVRNRQFCCWSLFPILSWVDRRKIPRHRINQASNATATSTLPNRETRYFLLGLVWSTTAPHEDHVVVCEGNWEHVAKLLSTCSGFAFILLAVRFRGQDNDCWYVSIVRRASDALITRCCCCCFFVTVKLFLFWALLEPSLGNTQRANRFLRKELHRSNNDFNHRNNNTTYYVYNNNIIIRSILLLSNNLEASSWNDPYLRYWNQGHFGLMSIQPPGRNAD